MVGTLVPGDLVGTLASEVARLRADNAALHERAEAQRATIAALSAENQALRDEVARLKGLPPRPPSRPSGMEKATSRGTGVYRAVQIQATGAEETPATGAVAGLCPFPPKSQTAQALTAHRAFGSSAL